MLGEHSVEAQPIKDAFIQAREQTRVQLVGERWDSLSAFVLDLTKLPGAGGTGSTSEMMLILIDAAVSTLERSTAVREESQVLWKIRFSGEAAHPGPRLFGRLRRSVSTVIEPESTVPASIQALQLRRGVLAVRYELGLFQL